MKKNPRRAKLSRDNLFEGNAKHWDQCKKFDLLPGIGLGRKRITRLNKTVSNFYVVFSCQQLTARNRRLAQQALRIRSLALLLHRKLARSYRKRCA